MQVTIEQMGAEVKVSVTDNGIGIAANMLRRLFRTVTQVDGELGRKHGGLDIGLCIVQRLVQMHRDSVLVRSSGLGTGSEFVVRFPLALALPVVASEPATENDPVSPTVCKRILVADNNVDSADSLAMLCSRLKATTRKRRTIIKRPPAVQQR